MTAHSATLAPLNPLAVRWQRESAGPMRLPARYLFRWQGGLIDAFTGDPPAGPVEVAWVVDGIDLASLPTFAVTAATADDSAELAVAVGAELQRATMTVAVHNRSREAIQFDGIDVHPGGDRVATMPTDPGAVDGLLEALLEGGDDTRGWMFGAPAEELDGDLIGALCARQPVDYLRFAQLVARCGTVATAGRTGGRRVVTIFGPEPLDIGFAVEPAAMPGVTSALRAEVWTADRVPRTQLAVATDLDLTDSGVTVIDDLLGNGAVQRLVLDGCALLDTSPLATMNGLRELSLRGVKLDSLRTLADLPALWSLALDRRPFAGLAALPDLRSLRRLDVSGLPLTSLAELSGPAELTDLAWSSLNRDPVAVDPLAQLRALERLSLRSRGVVGLDALSGLDRLATLDLVGSGVVDPSPLAALPELVELSLAATPFADWAMLRGLSVVRRLSLANSLIVSLGDLVLPAATDLDLSHTAITDIAVLRSWPQLRTVDITGTVVDPNALADSSVTVVSRVPRRR
jgi:hypothetical protein